MFQSLLEQISERLAAIFGRWLSVVPWAAALIIVLWVLWRLFQRRGRFLLRPRPELRIAVSALGDEGPPPGPPTLEFYNLPVRLAAVILAAAGRSGELPAEEETDRLLEAIIPGLDKIAELHRPLIRRWPNQLSARGFAHLVFNNVRLPGLGGKGTPWSAAAGVFKFHARPVMAGLILRAAAPNSLGQFIIETEHQWLGCLRVRWD